MSAETSAKPCLRQGCEAPTSGLCLEGFKPWSDCPYYRGETPAEPASGPATTAGKLAAVKLPEELPLTTDEAESETRATRTRVIVVGGAYGSGKTTLITSIYESFLDAPFAGQLFGGSRTLRGFEMACHEGRKASGRESADTLRTNPALGVRFYHLRLSAQSRLASKANLLIADMSGELFRDARDSASDAQKLGVLRRADRLSFLVDGEKLASLDERAVAHNDARSILRALVEAELVTRRTHLDIVFSKWDRVEGAKLAAREYIDMIQRDIASRIEPAVGQLRFFSVAARPDTIEAPFAFGVAELFSEWVGCEPFPHVRLSPITIPTKSRREFARYGADDPQRGV